MQVTEPITVLKSAVACYMARDESRRDLLQRINMTGEKLL